MSSMGRREFITLLGGAAAAWPLAAHAQQPGERIRRVGVLMGGAETDVESPARVKVFQEAPERLGWIVGRNLQIDYRWTMADAERTQVGSMELLRLVPDVLVGDGITRTAALVQASRTVPVVFVLVGGPVALGVVQSFPRPGGNATGFTAHEVTVGPKFLETLKEVAPQLKRVAVLFNARTSPVSLLMGQAIQAAAHRFAVEVILAPVREPGEIEVLLRQLGAESGSGLIVPPDNYATVHRRLILDLSRASAADDLRLSLLRRRWRPISYGVEAIDPFRSARQPA